MIWPTDIFITAVLHWATNTCSRNKFCQCLQTLLLMWEPTGNYHLCNLSCIIFSNRSNTIFTLSVSKPWWFENYYKNLKLGSCNPKQLKFSLDVSHWLNKAMGWSVPIQLLHVMNVTVHPVVNWKSHNHPQSCTFKPTYSPLPPFNFCFRSHLSFYQLI